MMPYNLCENKWVSKTYKKTRNHLLTYRPLYEIVFGISVMIVVILGLITSLNSFW